MSPTTDPRCHPSNDPQRCPPRTLGIVGSRIPDTSSSSTLVIIHLRTFDAVYSRTLVITHHGLMTWSIKGLSTLFTHDPCRCSSRKHDVFIKGPLSSSSHGPATSAGYGPSSLSTINPRHRPPKTLDVVHHGLTTLSTQGSSNLSNHEPLLSPTTDS